MLKSPFLIVSLIALVGCTSGGPAYRLIVNNSPCGEDQKDLQKLNDNDQSEFFNVLAPIGDMDRAIQTTGVDDPKITKPEVQAKMGTDITTACIYPAPKKPDQKNKNLEYQTYKESEKTVTGGVKDKTCPITLKQIVKEVPDSPALSSSTNPKKVTKSVKSNLELNWAKVDPSYKLLGLVQAVKMNGLAETFWHKPDPEKNIEVTTEENYELVVTLDNGKTLTGHQKICKIYQREKESTSGRDVRYEATVVRVGLKFEGFFGEGKFITSIKQVLNEQNSWETDHLLRNDFYLNSTLPLSDGERVTLEQKRREKIGFQP